MFVLLPLVSFALLFLIFSYRKDSCWRSSILLSAMLWGVLLTVITEILSFFKLLSFGWVLGLWVLSSLGLGLLYQNLRKNRKGVNRRREQVQEQLTSIEQTNIFREPSFRALLLGILFIVVIVGFVALVAPPNTNDSMGYHMPRIMHWVQNRTVAPFPTNYTAQLFLSPWSAFAMLHLQILGGSDRYVNLVQWFSMIGSIVGISLVAKQLGANIYGQIFAAVFCATIPMGILQGSSTQNDYVVAFWLICLVYYILSAIQDQPQKTYFWQIGISLGLALFTKPTAYLYSFPFLIWLVVVKAKQLGWKMWKPASGAAILALLINVLHFSRNLALFHNPLGTSPDYIVYTNKEVSIPVLFSNIIKNLAMQFSTPSPAINRFLIEQLTLLHSIFNIDINDPRNNSSDFQLNSLINHEDLAGNAIHLLLIIVSIAFLSFNWKKKFSHSPVLNYVLCILGGFFLFCLILAWTPFHTRLHLSLFVLSSAFVGYVFSKLWRSKLVITSAFILLVLSMPLLFFNENKPIIANSNFIKTGKVENLFNTDRIDLYFMGRRYLKEPMIGAANFIKSQQCSNIGISFDKLEIFEYGNF
jgi:4-amino-4-deoxy-L-arabinose transferase-like glycosyltransferase